jgi:hypothetical protein
MLHNVNMHKRDVIGFIMDQRLLMEVTCISAVHQHLFVYRVNEPPTTKSGFCCDIIMLLWRKEGEFNLTICFGIDDQITES